MPTDPLDLDRLDALAAAATPVPWTIDDERGREFAISGVGTNLLIVGPDTEWGDEGWIVAECDNDGLSENPDADVAFIVAVRNAYNTLSSELRQARAALEAVKGLLPEPNDENAFAYDPYDDPSVDPTNLDDVVDAAVSRGWDAGERSLATRLRAAIAAHTEGSDHGNAG